MDILDPLGDLIQEEDKQLKTIAEARYQRCLIAESDLRYYDALDLIQKASALFPNEEKYKEKLKELNVKYKELFKLYLETTPED